MWTFATNHWKLSLKYGFSSGFKLLHMSSSLQLTDREAGQHVVQRLALSPHRTKVTGFKPLQRLCISCTYLVKLWFKFESKAGGAVSWFDWQVAALLMCLLSEMKNSGLKLQGKVSKNSRISRKQLLVSSVKQNRHGNVCSWFPDSKWVHLV